MRARSFPALACLLVAGACAASPPGARLITPKVHVVGLDALSGDERSMTARVRLRVQNPNPFPVRVERVAYRIQIEERATAEGETTESLVVPARGDTETPMVIRAPFRQALAAGIVLFLVGEVRYRLELTLYFWTPVVNVSVPARDSGSIRLDELFPGAPAPAEDR